MRTPVSSALRACLLLGFACALLVPGLVRADVVDSVGPGAAPGDAAPSARVVVLGDSISAAYGMDLEQGWVAILAQRLSGSKADTEFVNASISGDTSAGGLRRLPALLEAHRPEVLILELGGNDGLRGYPTQRLRDNLTAMAELGRAAGARVVILPMEIPPNYGPRYTSAFRASFREAAEASGARLGPFLLDGIATDPALMQADGIHPTVEAQPLIADLLEPVIAPLLADSRGTAVRDRRAPEGAS
jgi:acyl-CoA thioesterase-1